MESRSALLAFVSVGANFLSIIQRDALPVNNPASGCRFRLVDGITYIGLLSTLNIVP